MKMISFYRISFFLSASLVLFSACSSAEKGISVLPQVQRLTPDSCGNIQMDLSLNLPAGYMARRSRLIVVPQLREQNRVLAEYDPIVLDAPIFNKKKHRTAVLEGTADPFAPYAQAVTHTGRAQMITVNQKAQLPEGSQNGRSIVGLVTTDGCGHCTATDSVLMAVVVDPVELIQKEALRLVWMEPKFVIRPKIRQGRGEAHLQFDMNKYDIRMDLGRNRSEMDQMLQTLRPIVTDSLSQLTSLRITGLASADGPLRINTPLARNRALSAQSWLEKTLSLTEAQRKVLRSGSRPEGWQPVFEAIVQAGDADSVALKSILTQYASYNDDVQERYVRKLPFWNKLKQQYLQGDRKVEYVYSYSIRSFTTDEELLAMYQTRPDAFNEEELLRVSTLKQSDEEKMEVYRTILHYFPQSQVASNNLAVLLLRAGKEHEAEQVLQSLDSVSDYALNTLAATYVYRNQYEKAVELLQKQSGTQVEARYNLGLVRAMQRRLNEAYTLLQPYEDVNASIVALSLNKTEDAARFMKKCQDKGCYPSYVRALIHARLQQCEPLFESLQQAVTDKSLRERACNEYDFMPYHQDVRWHNMFDK